MTEIRTSGVIVRKTNMGEADRLLTILTPAHGKIKAMAKGARKPKAKLAAWLDMFRYNEFTLVSGRTFYVVTGAQTVQGLLPESIDWDRLTVAYYICELVDKLLEEGQVLPGMFELVVGSLQAIAVGIDEQLVRANFEMKLLALLGNNPQLQVCAITGEELDPDGLMFFSLRLGGVVSERVATEDGFARAVNVSTVKLLRLMATHPLEVWTKVAVAAEVQKEALICVSDFMAYILDARPKSLTISHQLSN